MNFDHFFLKLKNSFYIHGILGTAYRILRYPFITLMIFSKRKVIFSSHNSRDIFINIYKTNWWGSAESFSGTGSTLAYTANVRERLPDLFKKLSIKTIYDAPCGDFNWMKVVVDSNDIHYIGADIVPQLIEKSSASYGTKKVKFHTKNIIEDKFPSADLWICRDCFIHFSFQDILLTLENFASSDIPYLLTTTHINTKGFKNIDIKTGDVRLLDLFSHPFLLPHDSLYSIDDWAGKDHPKQLVLFSRHQIITALPKIKTLLKKNLVKIMRFD
ncbi:hypothetical protein MCEHALH13_00857 [Candidatus Methylopumilus universalis]|uniref:hypothetical protein n=1 Tax=Candidatus Methylopumilus universalis TaxID=2588536 RepID=UPI003BEECF5D